MGLPDHFGGPLAAVRTEVHRAEHWRRGLLTTNSDAALLLLEGRLEMSDALRDALAKVRDQIRALRREIDNHGRYAGSTERGIENARQEAVAALAHLERLIEGPHRFQS